MSQDVMKPVNLFYVVYNDHKMELWEEALAENYQAFVNGHLIPNRDVGKGFVEAFHNAFPNLKYNLDDTIVQGDKVITRWTAAGTHTGDFFGMPATNKDVTMLGITIFRVENGKIAELWNIWDQNGLMQQLNG
jgi:steroid delta-isomerase-like uncharacterized protein